jgi:hypothetical protein
MPAIKTLKLLAHGDSYRPISSTQQSHSLIRASSLNTQKNSYDKNLTQSKSLRILSSRTNNEQLNENNKIKNSEKQNNDSEQAYTGTDDGDS